MIDLHSHIIWEVDDGSESKEMTLNMLKEAEANNTKKILATPHFFRGSYECTYNDVKEKLEKVKTLAKENNINIEIYPGQEIYYRENIFQLYEEGTIGTLNGTRYMLIELPMISFYITEVVDNLYELTLKGIVPVLAHPERYKPIVDNPELINTFIKEGYLFQLNAGSIEGYFGKDVKKTAEIFVNHKIYNFIGSDAHKDIGRNTDMTAGIKQIESIKKGYLNEITESTEKLLKNEEVEFLGKKIEKKGFFSFFKK